MSSSLERSFSAARPQTKRGRHNAAPATPPHTQSQPLHHPAFSVANGSDDEYDCGRSARVYLRHSDSTSAAAAASSALPHTLPTASYHSYSTSSPLDSPLYSPSTSPLSHSRVMSGCSTSSHSASPLHSSQLASSSGALYSELSQSPVQHMKRLCVNNMDGGVESADEDAFSRSQHNSCSQPHPPARQQQGQTLPTSSSFSHHNSANRVLLKAKRSSAGPYSASITPYQSPPNSRPSTASSATIRASFNLSEPSVNYYSSMLSMQQQPASSVPTSTDASPQPSTTASPQTHYTTLMSSSLPSGSAPFLSLLNLSCASVNSSFSSPAQSPTGNAFYVSSQQATPSSAHSSASFRPRIMSAQARAALFPSRSVTSSPTPDSQCSTGAGHSSRQRTSTGKRSNDVDAPVPLLASIDASSSRRVSEGGGRNSKRVKEDRRRDRRRSIVSPDREDRCGTDLVSDDEGEECEEDMMLRPAHATVASGASRFSLYIGSSNSLSSLDSPSSTSSYPRMSAPLNSPVSGSQGRRGHIAVDHLLGTAAAAAAASVARRRNSSSSLYEEEEEEEEQGLVDAVGAMQLCGEANNMLKGQEEEVKEADELQPKLPAAPRLATRTASLRLNLVAAASQPSYLPFAESDGEQACADTDDDSIVLSSSLMPSRQQSSSADYYESYIPSTGSFSKVLRAHRQSQMLGSSTSSSSSSSSSPFPPSPALSPVSPAMPLHDDSYMSSAAGSDSAVVVVAPLSLAAFTSNSSSFSSLSGTLNSTFSTGPPSTLSPFASMPDYPAAGFTRSLSHTVDPRRLPFGGRQHTAGVDKQQVGGAGTVGFERGGDGVGLDMPFLKELSLPPRGPAGRRSAMN